MKVYWKTSCQDHTTAKKNKLESLLLLLVSRAGIEGVPPATDRLLVLRINNNNNIYNNNNINNNNTHSWALQRQ